MIRLLLKDNKINSINQQQQSAEFRWVNQGQVSEIKKQQENLQAENDRLNEESERLSAEIDELSKILLLVRITCKSSVVLKQLELQQAILIRLSALDL